MLDPIDLESTYISIKKSWFKSIFKIDADDNLELFLQYLNEHTNRQLKHEIADLNKKLEEIKESGFFDS